MTDHLVIFAKSPRLGVAKRRLGRQIGMVPAWRFYRDALTSLLVRLGHDPRWRTWVYMTPDRDAELPIWLIGGRGRLRLPPGLFAGVRWSTPTLLRDTLANVPSRYSIGLTETLDDIDTAEALLEWRRRCGGIRPGRSRTKI
jgi:glycosyltransferase A (GT-A) superfamily protein (DUF2064 family)